MHTIKELNRYFGSKSAREIIGDVLNSAKTVRIATAYFEPSGYQLLHQVLRGKDVRLLVGYPEGGKDKIQAVVKDFMDKLISGPLEERTQAMIELRDALKQGRFLVSVPQDPIFTRMHAGYYPLHAKLYIADETRLVIGSSNMTYNGLIRNVEAGYVIADTEDVRFYVEKFDEFYVRSQSISEEILRVLEEWLNIYPPFVIYIRSLIRLYGLPTTEQIGHLPELNSYQRPVVSRVLRNLQEYSGAMLIASTGLGKTVMAAHVAAYLRMEQNIDNVIVVSPAGLRGMWDRMMANARIFSRQYSYHTFSAKDLSQSQFLEDLNRELSRADEKTLLIIDESHHLRNYALKRSEDRLRYDRILNTVRDKHCKILLMTATPYSKGVDDINSQLKLLPQRINELKMVDDWFVIKTLHVSSLSVCVVISTPSVVKNFCSRNENGERYILFFGDQPRYFPRKMHIHNVRFDNPVDDLLIGLLTSNLIGKRSSNDETESLFDTDRLGVKDPLFEARLMHHFCSSLKQADITMEKMQHEGGYENYRFENQSELTRLIGEYRRFTGKHLRNKGKNDDKMRKLSEILKKYPGEKIVIFCVYRKTSDYIKDFISEHFPDLRVETTYDKTDDELHRVICGFAPEANRYEKESGDDEKGIPSVDVLIATDAIAEGFNLQDSRLLVNFDLPWTVLILAQRIGRILRPWKTPREIYIFNLFPSTMENEQVHYALHWQNRLEKRNREFKDFAEIPVMIDRSQQSQSRGFEMIQLAKAIGQFEDNAQTEMDLDKVIEFIENTEEIYTSSFIDDLALVNDSERNRLMRLPNGIKSVKTTAVQDHLIFLLFGYRDQSFPTLFDEKAEIVMDHDRMDDIMQLIRSLRNEEAALPNMDDVKLDLWVEKCRDKWASMRDLAPEQLTVINRMLLVPK